MPTINGMQVVRFTKLADRMQQQSKGRINLRAVKDRLRRESEWWTVKDVPVRGLWRWDDADVDQSKGDLSKGPIISLGDGEILDGRHRTALAVRSGMSHIPSFVPFHIRESRHRGPFEILVEAAAGELNFPSSAAAEQYIMNQPPLHRASAFAWWKGYGGNWGAAIVGPRGTFVFVHRRGGKFFAGREQLT